MQKISVVVAEPSLGGDFAMYVFCSPWEEKIKPSAVSEICVTSGLFPA